MAPVIHFSWLRNSKFAWTRENVNAQTSNDNIFIMSKTKGANRFLRKVHTISAKTVHKNRSVGQSKRHGRKDSCDPISTWLQLIEWKWRDFWKNSNSLSERLMVRWTLYQFGKTTRYLDFVERKQAKNWKFSKKSNISNKWHIKYQVGFIDFNQQEPTEEFLN